MGVDLGGFGDERLRKAGLFCWNGCAAWAASVRAPWAAAGLVNFG